MLCKPQAVSMTASETPSLVLRNTSLTMRQRFTPARSCSTWTRICANFRLVRFSASVSSPRGGFFFYAGKLGLRAWRAPGFRAESVRFPRGDQRIPRERRFSQPKFATVVFFRLAGLLHRWLIALESSVLVQGGPRRVRDPFLIGYHFVVHLARARSA